MLAQKETGHEDRAAERWKSLRWSGSARAGAHENLRKPTMVEHKSFACLPKEPPKKAAAGRIACPTCPTLVSMIPRCIFISLALIVAALAQDTRTVVEPKIPPTCSVVRAALSSVERHSLADADEAKLDTERIQRAIDGCKPGQAVELKADGAHDAFVSGPVSLRPGITLLIAAKTILFASRNPRDYDLSAGSCGIVNETGHGCKPLCQRRRDGRWRDRWTRMGETERAELHLVGPC